MMIIEKTDKELAPSIQDLHDSLVTDPGNFEAISARYRLTKALATSEYYVGGHLNAYQKHALAGTEWKPKERGQQTYPQGVLAFQAGLLAICLGGYGMHCFAHGEILHGILSILGLLCTLLAGITMDYPSTRALLHNHRIKHVRIDRLKQYPLNSPVVNMLADNLNGADYNRMMDWLRQDISPELHRVFVDYYDKQELALETIGEFEGSSIESGTKDAYLSSLFDKANSLAEDAATTVRALFAEHDANVEREELEAKDKSEAEQLALEDVARLDEQFTNQTLIQKANYVLAL